jgi:hypothetical protein
VIINLIIRRTVMYKKLIYLTSIFLLLGLTGEGWPKAANPEPPDGTVLEDTWAALSWRPGPQAVSFDIYVGDNYEDVRNGTEGTFRGNQNEPFFIVGFFGYPYSDGLEPGKTYYWRVDEIINQRGDNISVGDVWSFKITPSKAHDPEPADGAELVETNVILSWEPGFGAKLHTVFFGDSFAKANSAAGGSFQGTTTYNPGILELGKTYYWRVDEFDGRETYKGDVWSFTVGTEGPPPAPEEGVYYVDAVNGSDHNTGSTPRTAFATIKKGIDAAEDGQVVLVYPGLYLEEVNLLGKALTVQGVAVSPDGVPVLWNPGDFAVSFYSGEGPNSILKNFIIKDSFMGVFIADGSPTLSNLTIVGNKYGIEAYAESTPDISNTILWDNTDSDLFGCRASYSCIERGSEGEGNISDDPLFVDADNGDYHIRSERGRYWPRFDIWVLDRVTSPCVDTGDPQAEVSNEPMPNGGRINIGAYGGTAEASLSLSELSKKASNPYPCNGAVDVGGYGISLTWTAGLNAVSHDVYFGGNRDAVANADTSDTTGIYRGRQAATSYAPPEVFWWPSIYQGRQATTGYIPSEPVEMHLFHWRIDEVDSEGNITKGDVWTFTSIPPSVQPPKGRACFVAETNVWIDGALVSISNVTARSSVGQIDDAAAKDSSISLPYLGKVEELQEHQGTFKCYDVLLKSGNRIGVAENHYFLTQSGQWLSVRNLKAGTKLRTATGSIEIVSVTKRPVPYTGKVYNLKVESSDRYLVGKDAIIVRDY